MEYFIIEQKNWTKQNKASGNRTLTPKQGWKNVYFLESPGGYSNYFLTGVCGPRSETPTYMYI